MAAMAATWTRGPSLTSPITAGRIAAVILPGPFPMTGKHSLKRAMSMPRGHTWHLAYTACAVATTWETR